MTLGPSRAGATVAVVSGASDLRLAGIPLAALDAIDGHVYVFDRQFRWVYVNPAGARVFRTTQAEMVGKTWDDLVAPDQTGHDKASAEEVFRTGRTVRTDRWFGGPDGERIYEYVLAPLLGNGGDVELVVTVGRDVTEQRVAEGRTAQLQQLTQRLGTSVDSSELAAIVVEQVHEHLQAAASVAYLAAPDGSMHLAASRGLPQATIERHGVLSLEAPVPLATALRERRPVWLGDRETLLRAYPNTATSYVPQSALAAVAALPLIVEGRLLGGIAFSLAKAIEFDAATREFLTTYARQFAQAIERARLHHEEHRARTRLTILAETSARFSEVRLDLPRVLETVCREVALRLPESCTVNLLTESGLLELVATHHVDPEAEEGIRKTLAGRPVHIGQGSLGRVAETGESLHLPVVPFAQMLASSPPEYRRYLERYPLGSLIVVPLRARERIIGTLTSARSPGLPAFDSDDCRLLQDLADRAAFAIDNARLFEAERKARQLRDDFLSIAGHELRTPLTALHLQVQSLQRLLELGEMTPDKLRDRLAKAERQTTRLGGLIDELLDVARLSGGGLVLTLQDVDFGVLVEEVAERFVEPAARTGSQLSLCIEDRMIGRWDRPRLDQVVTNLLANAVKYGEGKPIEVIVSREQDRAVLVVRDHGIGIDPLAQHRIFERFERAASHRNYGGFGLGLWISRQIVEALGGTIRLDDPESGTTTFRVELPLEQPAS